VKISPGLGLSTLLESSSSLHSAALDLSNELDIELWFRGKLDRPQSVLIRSTNPDGVTRSSFMHINGTVEQIPVFDNQDPLVLQEKREMKAQKVRDISWRADSPQRFRTGRFIAKAVSGLVLIMFFLSLVTGVTQLRVVLTGSMKPAINPGDMVVAISKDYVEPKLGKVVLYSARDLDGKAVTVWSHRIVAGNAKTGFTIKGDANSQPDIGIIPLSDIQTVVVLRIPYVGHIFNIYSLALIFSGLLLLSFVSSQRKRE
jgi:signal peptidase I